MLLSRASRKGRMFFSPDWMPLLFSALQPPFWGSFYASGSHIDGQMEWSNDVFIECLASYLERLFRKRLKWIEEEVKEDGQPSIFKAHLPETLWIFSKIRKTEERDSHAHPLWNFRDWLTQSLYHPCDHLITNKLISLIKRCVDLNICPHTHICSRHFPEVTWKFMDFEYSRSLILYF